MEHHYHSSWVRLLEAGSSNLVRAWNKSFTSAENCKSSSYYTRPWYSLFKSPLPWRWWATNEGEVYTMNFRWRGTLVRHSIPNWETSAASRSSVTGWEGAAGIWMVQSKCCDQCVIRVCDQYVISTLKPLVLKDGGSWALVLISQLKFLFGGD